MPGDFQIAPRVADGEPWHVEGTGRRRRARRRCRGLALAVSLVLAGCNAAGTEPVEGVEGDGQSAEFGGEADDEAGNGAADETTSDEGNEAGDAPASDGAWRDLAQDDGSFHPDDFAEARAACVREQGFPAEANPEEQGVRYEPVPEAQQDAQSDAIAACERQVEMDPRWSEPREGEQLDATYAWYIEETIPCLEDAGITADWDVPSYETFAALWPTPDQWNPYLEIEDPDDTLRGQRECPDIPFDELYD